MQDQKNSHMVQSEVFAVAKSLGNDKFKTSTRWWDDSKKRHNVVWNRVCVNLNMRMKV
jgi:hypothetical protein